MQGSWRRRLAWLARVWLMVLEDLLALWWCAMEKYLGGPAMMLLHCVILLPMRKFKLFAWLAGILMIFIWKVALCIVAVSLVLCVWGLPIGLGLGGSIRPLARKMRPISASTMGPFIASYLLNQAGVGSPCFSSCGMRFWRFLHVGRKKQIGFFTEQQRVE